MCVQYTHIVIYIFLLYIHIHIYIHSIILCLYLELYEWKNSLIAHTFFFLRCCNQRFRSQLIAGPSEHEASVDACEQEAQS